MVIPQPVSPDTGATTAVNPLSPVWQTDGGCDPSAVSGVAQDWYYHTQGFYGMYQRKQNWRDCNNRTALSPSVEYNYTDNNVTVWTADQIIYGATFSACLVAVQSINIQASGACSSTYGTSGWGQEGLFVTSGLGGILRPARKDANGVIIDETGNNQQSFNMALGKAPDNYSCSSGWDTLSNAKADLAQLLNILPDYCKSFNPALVSI